MARNRVDELFGEEVTSNETAAAAALFRVTDEGGSIHEFSLDADTRS